MSLGLAGDDDNDNDDDDDDNESKRAVVMNWWQLRLRDRSHSNHSPAHSNPVLNASQHQELCDFLPYI